ncbi:MAG TPA: hypothetical protein VLI39_04660 [Sedimentisphaerales bacterium]|nr:hypothetical protein [Sedimentisphaerales bacterium]
MVGVPVEYERLPRRSLGFFPTPLVPLPRLTEELAGPRIFMKRDDQTGLALGGLMDMIARGELGSKHSVLFWHTGGTPALFSYANDLRR